MVLPQETLFPGESDGSLDFKTARLAREFRRVLITTAPAHITMMGTIRPVRIQFLSEQQLDSLIKSMVERFKDAQQRLIAWGVPEQMIFGFLPVRQSAGPDEVIVASVAAGALPAMNELGPAFGPREPPSAVTGGDRDEFIKGQIVIDPLAKMDDPPDPPSHVETQIEITLWDRKPVDGGRKIFFTTAKVTFNVTPERIDEIGAELPLVTLKIAQHSRHFPKAQLSVKLSPKASVDIGTVARVKKWTDSQIKLSCEAEFHGIQIEPTLGVDARGKPAAGIELTFPLPFGL